MAISIYRWLDKVFIGIELDLSCVNLTNIRILQEVKNDER